MSKKLDEAMLGSRAGYTHTSSEAKNDSSIISGLELSELLHKPIAFFKPNPENEVFNKLKEENYFFELKKDIDESRRILNPLISMPDGLLIEGHSRLRIATELENEGRGIGKIPVRIILSNISENEIKKRVYLGNLLRFEIDENTRILLFSKIWPDYFNNRVIMGRPKKSPTVSELSLPVSEISKKTGKSESQLRLDRSILKQAEMIAQTEGRDEPTVSDISIVRKSFSDNRRKKSKIPYSKQKGISEKALLPILFTIIDETIALFPSNIFPGVTVIHNFVERLIQESELGTDERYKLESILDIVEPYFMEEYKSIEINKEDVDD